MKHLFSLLLVCWATNTFAQNLNNIQQLQKQRLAATSDTARSRILHELGVQYEQTNVDSCLYFLSQSLEVAQRSRDAFATARAMFRLSHTYLYLSKDESKALEWANKCIAIAKPAKDYIHLAKCFQSLAVISAHQGIGNAEELAKQMALYAEKSNDWLVIADAYATASGIYISTKNYKQAEVAAKKRMAIVKNHDLDLWLSTGVDYLKLLQKNNKPRLAKKVGQQLAAMKGQLQQSQGEWIYLNDMANIETISENYTEAERLLFLGIDKEKQKAKADTLHLYFFYQSLMELYVAKKDYKKAYESGMKFAELRQWLKDKRQTQDSKLKMTQLKASLDLEKKETEIALLAEQKKEQQLLLIAASIIGVLLIGFVVVLQRSRSRIERQKAELTSLNSTKDKLFAILSHDLRSPVKSLSSYFMLINWGALSQAEFVESVQSFNTQLSSFHDMLENVLNWAVSQLGGMQPKREKTFLLPVIEEQMQLLAPVAKAKEIQMKYQIPSEVQLEVDKNHLAVIVRNLLHNAIKFTRLGGKVSLTHFEKDGKVYLEIKDTGVGLSKEKLNKLFELDKDTSQLGTAQEKGTGLGLVLVKELVDANQGTIEVTSEIDKGSTFLVSFPQ
jgi:signal transduction histidine kinase